MDPSEAAPGLAFMAREVEHVVSQLRAVGETAEAITLRQTACQPKAMQIVAARFQVDGAGNLFVENAEQTAVGGALGIRAVEQVKFARDQAGGEEQISSFHDCTLFAAIDEERETETCDILIHPCFGDG